MRQPMLQVRLQAIILATAQKVCSADFELKQMYGFVPAVNKLVEGLQRCVW